MRDQNSPRDFAVRASQRLLLSGELEKSRVVQLNIDILFDRQAGKTVRYLANVKQNTLNPAVKFSWAILCIANDIYPEAKRYIPAPGRGNALRSDNLFAQRDPIASSFDLNCRLREHTNGRLRKPLVDPAWRR